MQDSVSQPFYNLWLCYKEKEGTRNIYKPDTTQLTLVPAKLSCWCRPLPAKDGSTVYTKLYFQPTALRYKYLEGHLERHLISIPCYETAESSLNLHTKFHLISSFHLCISKKYLLLWFFNQNSVFICYPTMIHAAGCTSCPWFNHSNNSWKKLINSLLLFS